jgi:hypothetical protein
MQIMKRLTNAAATVGFDPLENYREPEHRGRVLYRALDGTPKRYDFGGKLKDVVPTVVSAADGSTLNTWWRDQTALTYFYDLTVGSNTINVHIANKEKPMQPWPYAKSGWTKGVLDLDED